MATSKIRTQMRAAIGDKVTERLTKLEVSLENLTETVSWHISATETSLKSLSIKLDDLSASITTLIVKNAEEQGKKLALEKRASTVGAFYGVLFGGGILTLIRVIEFLFH